MTESARRTAGGAGRAAALWLAPLTALALWARVSSFRTVFVRGEVLPYDGDSAYHLRRILATLERFPNVPSWDPYLDWPKGAHCPWAPGFDFLDAASVLLCGAAADPSRAARAACLFPILVGVALVWATFGLARRLAGPTRGALGVAGAAGIFAALLPQSIGGSVIGCVDHHGAEALAMALLGWWGLEALHSDPARPRAAARDLRFECAGALLGAAALFVFAGATIYVAIAAMLLAGITVTRPGPGAGGARALLGSGAPALAAAALLVAILYAPSVREHGLSLSFQFPSYLQPVLLLAASGVCAAAAGARRLLPAERITPRVAALRLAVVLLGGVLSAALAAAASPGAARATLSGLTGWLGRRDPWLAGIREFQPIYLDHPPFSIGAASRLDELFGVLGPASVVLAPLGLWAIARIDRRRGAVFLAWTAAVALLTIWQSRFARVFVVNLALVSAFALYAIVVSLARRRGAPGTLVAAVAAVVALADPRLRSPLALAPPRALSGVEAASLFLRDHAPAVSPGARSGVLTDWDFGSTVLWLARRPVIASTFGPYAGEDGFRDAERAPFGSEEEMIEIMERRDAGYFVGGATTFLGRVKGPKGTAVVDPDYLRATPLGTLWVAGSGIPGAGIPQASRLSAVFASPHTLSTGAQTIPWLWVYERVPGARLVGRARPGARVVARLEFAARGAPFAYAAWGDAGEDGRFTIAVALPTDARLPGIATDRVYRIDVGEGSRIEVAVPESAVRGGETVPIGSP